MEIICRKGTQVFKLNSKSLANRSQAFFPFNNGESTSETPCSFCGKCRNTFLC